MKRAKRHWYQNIYWEYIPHFLLKGLVNNSKTIIYLITVAFIFTKITAMYCNVEESADIQKVLQAQKQVEIDKQNQKAVEKAEKEYLARVEAQRKEQESRKLSEEYKTKATAKLYPKGTYLKNKETNEVGQVKEIQAERVITNTFYFDTTYNYDDDIVEYMSYKAYKKAVQYELDHKKLTNKEIQERQEQMKEIKAKETEETKKTWKVGDCFTYNGDMYEVKGIEGTELVCYKAKSKVKGQKRFNFRVNANADGIERISWHEFISKC